MSMKQEKLPITYNFHNENGDLELSLLSFNKKFAFLYAIFNALKIIVITSSTV